MSPNIAIRIVLRSMRRNANSVYGFVFGPTFCAGILTAIKIDFRSQGRISNPLTPFCTGNFVDHKSVNVSPQMAVENGLQKFLDFILFTLNLEFDPAIDEVFNRSHHLVPGRDRFDEKRKPTPWTRPSYKTRFATILPAPELVRFAGERRNFARDAL